MGINILPKFNNLVKLKKINDNLSNSTKKNGDLELLKGLSESFLLFFNQSDAKKPFGTIQIYKYLSENPVTTIKTFYILWMII